MLSFIIFVLFSLICLFGVIVGTIGVLSDYSSVNVNIFMILLCLFTTNICLGIYIFLPKSNEGHWTPWLRSCHVIISCILVGLFLFCRSLVADCSNNDPTFIINWSCNPQYDSNTLPVDTMLMLMLVPLIYASTFENAISWGVLLSSWVITVSWLVVCIAFFKAYNSVFALVFYAPLSFMILYKNRLSQTELCDIIDDKNNEIIKIKLEAESTKSEQENMISNVTHDLKTVSTTLL